MFDKQTGKWINPAIKSVAQSRGYFTQEVEDRLNELVETPGHRALQRLRGGDLIDAENAEDLIRYVAVMMTRVPKRRHHARSLVPGVIEQVTTRIRAEFIRIANPATDSRVAALLRQVDAVEEKLRAQLPTDVKDQIDSPWPSEQILAAIHSMCWRIVLVPSESPLITSDNPAFYFSAFGIGSPESELTFPIAPNLALLGSRQGRSGETFLLREKRPMSKEVNRRIAVGAHRFIFASHPFRWVHTIAGRSEPNLSRIFWRDAA
jgi:hypothetical protein